MDIVWRPGTRLAGHGEVCGQCGGRGRPALVAILMTVVTGVVVVGSQLAADAGGKPPEPKPGKPPGKVSALNFDQFPPSPTDDVLLRWDEADAGRDPGDQARTDGGGACARGRAHGDVRRVGAVRRRWPSARGSAARCAGRPPSGPPSTSRRRSAMRRTGRCVDLFPAKAGRLRRVHDDRSATTRPTPPPTPTTPQGIGNVTAQAVLDARHHDGANQLGDEPGGTAARRTRTGPATRR